MLNYIFFYAAQSFESCLECYFSITIVFNKLFVMIYCNPPASQR